MRWIHLGIQMKWTSVNMWCEGHIFLVERHISPFGGTSAPALWVLPLRGQLRSVGTTFGSPVSAPHKSQNPQNQQKLKAHKGVFCERKCSLARATKPKTKPHKSVFDESRRRWRSAQNQTSAGHKGVLGE